MTYVVVTGVATLRHSQNLRLPAGRELVDGFVPQEPAAMPFLHQGEFGERARRQPVVVAHHLGPHARHRSRTHRQVYSARFGCSTQPHPFGRRSALPLMNEGVSAPNNR
ncbi:hypothetical protein EV641_105147 [Rhodococcus sp. SMB37]|nr:hypothetical protein EV641_105147 [Rhodococcus sp. SMB37]